MGRPQQVRSLLDGSTFIKSLKLDVTLPGRVRSLPPFKLETGAKFSQVAARNDFLFQREINGTWQAYALRTNQFEYDETIYAAYGSVSEEWQKPSPTS